MSMRHNGDTRLILFDIDCTLLQPAGVGRAATKLAMQEIFGTTGGLDDHQFGGKTDWQTLSELLADEGYDPARIGEMMHVYEAAMERHISGIIGGFPVRACPGALELASALRARDDVGLGVITGNVRAVAPIKLRAAGFDPAWFPVGAYGSEAHRRNDLPAIALARAQQHYGQRIQPEQVIIVGDTPMDIACARALGGVAVAVRTGFCAPGELEAAQPDFMLDDLTTFMGEVLGT